MAKSPLGSVLHERAESVIRAVVGGTPSSNRGRFSALAVMHSCTFQPVFFIPDAMPTMLRRSPAEIRADSEDPMG